MISKLLLFVLYILCFCKIVNALEVDIDKNKILLDTNFNGDKIILSGKKQSSGEVIVIFKSKKTNFKIYTKEKVLGVWKNSNEYIFKGIYKTYKLYTEKSSNLRKDKIFRDLQIGLYNIQFKNSLINNKNEIQFLQENFIKKEMQEGNFEENYKTVISSKDLNSFILEIDISPNIKAGDYFINVFLLDNGNLIAFKNFDISVKQVGFLFKLKQMSEKQKLLYSILAILTSCFISFGFFVITNKILYHKK